MRELKFRAWDRVKRKMLYGVSPFNVHITDENEPLLSLEYSKHDDCEFEQYTGLKDKNGKEIYEGDIVEYAYTRCKYIVVYRRYDASFVLENDDREEIIHLHYDRQSDYEVAGSIHENPELLEEE